MPLATFRHTAVAPVPPAEVWEALRDAETWARIGPIDEVFDARHDDDGALAGFAFRTSAAGKTFDGSARRAASDEGSSLEFALATSEIRARVSIEIESVPDGTSIAVRLEAEPAGMLATLFWGVVRETITSDFTRRVDEFAEGLGD